MQQAHKQKIEAQIELLKSQLKEANADTRPDIERRIDELQRLL